MGREKRFQDEGLEMFPCHQLGAGCRGVGGREMLSPVKGTRNSYCPLVFSFRLKHSGDFYLGILREKSA